MNYNDRATNDLSADEVYGEITKNSSFYQSEVNGQIRTFRNTENTPDLALVEQFVESIIKTNHSGFKKYQRTNRTGVLITEFKHSPLSYFFKHINSFIRTIYDHDSFYIYSENVNLFLDACNELKFNLITFSNHLFFCLESEKFEADLFNELIELIRNRSNTDEFSKKASYRKTHAVRIFKSCKGYIEALFNTHYKLLVIRLDLSYLVTIDESNGKPIQLVTLEQARKDFSNFINNKRHNSLFKNMVGYICKLEFGAQKGYHFHLIFFFLGSKVQNDPYIAHRIGTYWREVITAKRGIFFNCNLKKRNYQHLGIGMMHADSPIDSELRFNLINRVLRYLTKSEQFLKIKLAKNDRVISKGKMPVRISNAGRPRNSWLDGLAQRS